MASGRLQEGDARLADPGRGRHGRTGRSVTTAVVLLFSLVPPLSVLWLVSTQGVDVPYWDQWDFLPLIAKAQEGELTLQDLWQPHNEHRLFFPKLIMLALAWLTDWNIRAELLTNWVLAALALTLVLRLFVVRAEQLRLRALGWLYIAIGAASVFGLSQWQNWLWGWQLQIFLNVLGVLVTVWVLRPREDRLTAGELFLAALSACLSSFSFGTGLMLWVAAVPLVWARAGSTRRRLVMAGVWVSLGALTSSLYMSGLWGVLAAGDPSFSWRQALHLGAYVAIYLGAPLFAFSGHAALYGGFGAALAVLGLGAVTWRKGGSGEWAAVWLCLLAYAILAAMMTATGRIGLGIGQALSSRYITIGNLFWLGGLGLGLELAASVRSDAARRLLFAAGCGVLALVVVSGFYGRRQFSDQARRLRSAASLLTEGSVGTAGEVLYPSEPVLRQRVEVLRRHGLSVFADD